MLDRELLPAEKEAQNQPLIEDLTRYFDTQAEDRASLASIRARLLQKTASTVPVADLAEEIKLPAPLPLYRAKNTRTKLLKRHPYLNALVAACLLVVLVGSFAVVSNRRSVAGSFPPAPTPKVAHDWSILQTFSGTGSKTIDGLDIDVGHKYGLLTNCTNTTSGLVALTVNGWQSTGAYSCAMKATEPFAPTYTSVSTSVGSLILSIKVTANASTSWKLWLFKGVYYPPLSTYDGSGYRVLHNEIDGTGSKTIPVNITLPNGWDFLYACHGTGAMEVGLWSNVESPITNNKQVLCNGQTNGVQFNASGYPMNEVVHQIRIITNTDNDWQVILFGCTVCAFGTAAPTVTP